MIADYALAHLFVKIWNKNNRNGEELGVNWINSGWCYQFALVLRLIRKDAKIISTGHHVWIYWNGKHYDSNHMSGSLEPLDRTCTCGGCEAGNFHRGPRKITIKYMKEYWARYGYSGAVQDNVVRSTVRQYKKQLAKVS